MIRRIFSRQASGSWQQVCVSGRCGCYARGPVVPHKGLPPNKRRRRLDQLSLSRVAAWGAIGGVLLSALFIRGASLGWGEVLAISTTFALASAVSASGSLALAGRAVRRELPDSRGDTAEAELLGGGN